MNKHIDIIAFGKENVSSHNKNICFGETGNKHIEEMARFMLEKSNSANATPIFTAEDGTEIVLGENVAKLLDTILEQAFIPFLAECLVKEGYRKQIDGEWITETEYYDDDYSECNVRRVYACSVCGRTERRKEPYCNCGAKMKGE